MKHILWFLLFATLVYHVKCAYKYEYFKRDFSKTCNSLRKYFSEFFAKVKELLLPDSNKKLAVRVRSGGQEDHRGQFTDYVHKAWSSGLTTTENIIKSDKLFQMTTPILAQWHGRKMETHVIQTSDEYFLTVHRLPAEPNLRKRTVILHHGLLGSSMDWILLGPGSKTVLPYILSDAGYDVWLMNARGNYYSRGHATLTASMPEFWDFSIDEMGLIDIPAVVDYMRKQKNVAVPIDFVGHSMGSTAFLIFLSSVDYLRTFIRLGVLIAPLAFMNHINGPFNILKNVPDNIIKTMGEGEFLPNRRVPSWLARKYCRGPTVMCNNPLFFLSGISKMEMDSKLLARIRDHVPAGGSIKTILHYIQLCRSGKFHKYDNESWEYNIRNFTVPLALITSSNDWLAAVQDVQKIYYIIQNPLDHLVLNNKNISHTDFLWSEVASTVVFYKTLEYLEKSLLWKMMHENEVK